MATAAVKSTIHFPEPLEERINPPGFVDTLNLSYDQIKEAVANAEAIGYGPGAMVIRINTSYPAATLYYWGVIGSMNRRIPTTEKPYKGPCQVVWFGEHTPRVTEEWPNDLYLVMTSPTSDDIAEFKREIEQICKERKEKK